MKRKLIITEYDKNLFCIVFENDSCVEIHSLESREYSTGDIIVGRISKVSKQLSAYFVDIAPDFTVFLPFSECHGAEYKQEQLIPVRIIKDAIKTKEPVASMNLEIDGTYTVLLYDNKEKGVSVSKKITDSKERDRLKALYKDENLNKYRIVIRTAAKDVKEDILKQEISKLSSAMDNIIKYSNARTKGSVMYRGSDPLIKLITSFGIDSISEIITDKELIYNRLVSEYKNISDIEDKIRLYNDANLSLFSLYSLKSRFDEALCRKVWLKSGGYIVIDQTEAFNIIDVNSGKFDKKNDAEILIKQTNIEAAYETARQIRLRNLSGIILVDFINGSYKNEKELSDILKSEFSKDYMSPLFVDFTKLHIAEITRKKKSPSLREQIDNANKNK